MSRHKLAYRLLHALEQAEGPMGELAVVCNEIGNGDDRFQFDKYDERATSWTEHNRITSALLALRELADRLMTCPSKRPDE